MEKSTELLGELGVTMIAGSGDFSSTKGKVRSTKKRRENNIRPRPRAYCTQKLT